VENYRHLLLSFLIFLSICQFAAAQTAIAFYPYGAYSNETSLFMGGYAMLSRRPENLPTNFRPGSLEVNLIASFKKQVRVLIRNKIYLAGSNYSLGIPLRYYYWPSTFYGIGNSSKPDQEEKYTRKILEISPNLEYGFMDYYFLTFTAFLERSRISNSEAENDLLNNAIYGTEDFLLAGAGLKFSRSSVDNNYYPTKGSELSLATRIYHKKMGSDYSLRLVTLDIRSYFSPNENHTIAMQLQQKSASGDIPFEKYPDLGDEMRGLDSNKYINEQFLLYRIEDRIFPFISGKESRIGFAVFAETGQTFSSLSSIKSRYQKLSAGLGLRYLLLPAEMLTLRCDISFSSDGWELDIISFEAF
jgi:outer membrane protein assembly factor BamA